MPSPAYSLGSTSWLGRGPCRTRAARGKALAHQDVCALRALQGALLLVILRKLPCLMIPYEVGNADVDHILTATNKT